MKRFIWLGGLLLLLSGASIGLGSAGYTVWGGLGSGTGVVASGNKVYTVQGSLAQPASGPGSSVKGGSYAIESGALGSQSVTLATPVPTSTPGDPILTPTPGPNGALQVYLPLVRR